MKTSHVESALEQMSFDVTENSFGMEMAVSEPATLKFTESPKYDKDKINSAISNKNMAVIDEYEQTTDDSWKYEFYAVAFEPYTKLKVKMWPNSVNIYPKEGPTIGQLAQLTNAIERSMNATLTHDTDDL